MDCNDYSILIFDCDGVLIDSNNLKLEAAERILSDYPKEAVSGFIANFRKSFGRSRYDLFREFVEDFLEQPFDQNLYDGLIAAYGEKCSELYLKSPVIAGVEAFLSKNKGKTLYVASGGIESELKSVLSAHGLALMLGDAHTDFEAAQANDIDFLFCSKYTTDAEGMNVLQEKHGFKSVDTLEGVLG